MNAATLEAHIVVLARLNLAGSKGATTNSIYSWCPDTARRKVDAALETLVRCGELIRASLDIGAIAGGQPGVQVLQIYQLPGGALPDKAVIG